MWQTRSLLSSRLRKHCTTKDTRQKRDRSAGRSAVLLCGFSDGTPLTRRRSLASSHQLAGLPHSSHSLDTQRQNVLIPLNEATALAQRGMNRETSAKFNF